MIRSFKVTWIIFIQNYIVIVNFSTHCIRDSVKVGNWVGLGLGLQLTYPNRNPNINPNPYFNSIYSITLLANEKQEGRENWIWPNIDLTFNT